MSRSVKAVIVDGPGQWGLGEVDVEDRQPGEVLLELRSAGICGGDRAVMTGDNAVARYPLVLGHECVARVIEADASSELEPGQHVVMYPTIPCGRCGACAAARGNQCPNMVVMGLSHPRGFFAEQFVAAEEQCIPVSDELAIRYGALIEPMAVACHVATRSGIRAGEKVLIIGAGSIGLAFTAVARDIEAGLVTCVDQYWTRSLAAEALGADAFTAGKGDALRDWARAELASPDLVIDTVVTQDTADLALEVLRPGGRYAPVASSKPGQRVPVRYDHFFLKELTITAARNYVPEDFARAIELLQNRSPDLGSLITARFPLTQFAEAMEALINRPEQHIKILLDAEGES